MDRFKSFANSIKSGIGTKVDKLKEEVEYFKDDIREAIHKMQLGRSNGVDEEMSEGDTSGADEFDDTDLEGKDF